MQPAIHRLIASGALLALSTGAAFGQGYYGPDNDRGFYAGAGIGQFNVNIDGLDGLDETIDEFDADETAWKLFAGYRFTKFISAELAYVDFGEPDDQFTSGGSSGDYSIGLSGFAPYVIGTLPMGETPFELFAKLGYYFYDVEVNADLDDLGGDVFTTDDSGEDMLWGAGVGVTLMERLNVRVEYENIDVEGTDDAEAFWLSGSWRF